MKSLRAVLRDPLFCIAAFFVLLPSLFQFLWGMEGRAMIASPLMKDVLFQRSIIYISDHTIDGAVGFVLNKPYALTPPEKIAGFKGQIFWGGPLNDRTAISILFYDGHGLPIIKSLGDWQKTDPDILIKVAAHQDQYKMLIGFCRWQALQLELERLKRGWITEGVRRAEVLSSPNLGGDALWKKTLQESGFYKKTSLARRIGT